MSIKAVNDMDPIAKARAEVAKEDNEAAVKALKDVYRKWAAAEKVVANYQREAEDLEARVRDGSFQG